MARFMYIAGILIFLTVICVPCFDTKSQSNVQTKNDFVQKVHIIFMNHLDVGYADLVNNILNEYFVTYFPRANALGSNLTAGGYVETFVYTTHPWLVSMYLDCPPNLVLSGIKLKCPTEKEKEDFISAVQKGYIAWHASAMNFQVEFLDSWLFDVSLKLSDELDKRFNITRKTKVMSQRDVPGMTQSVIPTLVENGIEAISVGVNPYTPPPDLPTLFRWKHPLGHSVLANWHPGGYPNNPGPTPSQPGGLSRKDCAVVEGFKEALCFAFRTDNSGPPENMEELLKDYEILRAEFPNAELKASRLEDYFSVAMTIKDKLPIVTQEVGDTWIQGICSDPRKSADRKSVV